MGLVRAIGTRLVGKALRSVAKTVARNSLNRFAARGVTEASLKALLTTCLEEATDGQTRGFTLRRMDATPTCPQGWCVHIQNFDKLTSAKASQDDQQVRFSFRAVQYADDPQPGLEAWVWHPSHGAADNMALVFKSAADTGKAMFVQLLKTTIQITGHAGGA